MKLQDLVKEIVAQTVSEKHLTAAEKKKKEDIVKAMKKDFKGPESAMYAIATAKAKKVAEGDIDEARVSQDNVVDYLANALGHVWNMGRGNNSIDFQDMAQSMYFDMFGGDEMNEKKSQELVEFGNPFEKSAIESASGDKISHVEEDDYGRGVYWSASDDYVEYFVGDGGEIIKRDHNTNKDTVLGNMEEYGDGQNHPADDDMHEAFKIDFDDEGNIIKTPAKDIPKSTPSADVDVPELDIVDKDLALKNLQKEQLSTFVYVLLNKDGEKVEINADSWDKANDEVVKKYKGLDPMLISIDGRRIGGFSGIEPRAKSAAKQYGSKEAGAKVAGVILKKVVKEDELETLNNMNQEQEEFNAGKSPFQNNLSKILSPEQIKGVQALIPGGNLEVDLLPFRGYTAFIYTKDASQLDVNQLNSNLSKLGLKAEEFFDNEENKYYYYLDKVSQELDEVSIPSNVESLANKIISWYENHPNPKMQSDRLPAVEKNIEYLMSKTVGKNAWDFNTFEKIVKEKYPLVFQESQELDEWTIRRWQHYAGIK